MCSDAVVEQILRDDVVIIRMNRPGAKNSLTLAQIERLRSVLHDAIASPARRLRASVKPFPIT